MGTRRSAKERRAWFAEHLDCVSDGWVAATGVLFACPCCGYPTLDERGGYDICELCNWEDDGQDEPDVDKVRGGPNKSYSLTQARLNFEQRLVMYSQGDDPPIGGEGSDSELVAKRAIMAAFDAMPGSDHASVEQLWLIVESNRRILESELNRKIREYEKRMKSSDS